MTDKPDTPRPVCVSKAPPPITPIRVGRYTAPNAPPVPPPNWDKWGHMRDVELWEAVALSLNLEPDKLPVYLGAFERFGDDPFRICPQTFLDRLQVANSNCGISLGFKQVHKLKARCLVDLPAFGAWTVKLNIPNIPPAFAAMAETATTVPVVMPAQTAVTPAPVEAGGKKWNDEKLAELKTYREAHTMPETAVKFGISEQRIRELLPSKKAKAKPFAGLTHRMK